MRICNKGRVKNHADELMAMIKNKYVIMRGTRRNENKPLLSRNDLEA
jgi:hypothetical protein